MSNETDFKPMPYVYCGKRWRNGKFLACIAPLALGGLQKEWLVPWDRKMVHFAIGGVYEGSLFSETTVRGMTNVKYTGLYAGGELLPTWRALDEQAEGSHRIAALEKDAGKMDEIEKAMAPVRALYTAAVKRGDMNGAYAIEAKVLRLLHYPLKDK